MRLGRWKLQRVPLAIAYLSGCLTIIIYTAYYDSVPSRNLRVPQNMPSLVNTKSLDRMPEMQSAGVWVGEPYLNLLRQYGLVRSIPEDSILQTYSGQQLSLIIHSYLDGSDMVCSQTFRMGNLMDGGYEVCDDFPWRPVQPCIVYSFGINNEFSFDDDIGRSYGCDVFSFDPTMHTGDHRRSDHVTFYQLGIGGKDEVIKRGNTFWVFHRFSSLKAKLNHTGAAIDVVKLDVEQSEWPALANMMKERQLDNVRQLFVEYHHLDTNEKNRTQLLSRIAVLRELEKYGFRRFRSNKNCRRKNQEYPFQRSSCYEVFYVNGNFKEQTAFEQNRIG